DRRHQQRALQHDRGAPPCLVHREIGPFAHGPSYAGKTLLRQGFLGGRSGRLHPIQASPSFPPSRGKGSAQLGLAPLPPRWGKDTETWPRRGLVGVGWG